jgi:ParB-like chromosome segregation protein Spo0J
MNAVATQPMKQCPSCGGDVLSTKGPGRLCNYRGEADYAVPDDMVVPICKKCGAMWMSSVEVDTLGTIFQEEWDRRRHGGGKIPSSEDAMQPVLPVAIPIADIDADYEWNARSGDYRTSDCDESEGRGTLGIADSMEERGQDEAAIVRPHSRQKGKFSLVDGFRRFSAAEMLTARNSRIKGLPEAHLLCKVEDLSEVDARMMNLAKGTNRDNLKPADIAFGIGEAMRLGKTLNEVSRQIGKNKTYVSNLSQISNPLRFDRRLFDRWRKEGLPLSVDDILYYILKKNVPLEKQKEIVEEIIRGKHLPGKRPKNPAWKESAKRQAKELGFIIGRLVHEGFLPASVSSLDWEGAVMACCNLGRHMRGGEKQFLARPEQITELASVAEEKCAAAMNGQTSPWTNEREAYMAQSDKSRRQSRVLKNNEPAPRDEKDDDNGC